MKGEETDSFVKVSVSLRREIKPGIFLGQRLMFSSPPPGSSGLPLRVSVCVGSVPPGNAEPKRRLFPTPASCVSERANVAHLYFMAPSTHICII